MITELLNEYKEKSIKGLNNCKTRKELQELYSVTIKRLNVVDSVLTAEERKMTEKLTSQLFYINSQIEKELLHKERIEQVKKILAL